MSLKVAVQMDPIQSVNIEADTTFMLALEAQARGHRLWIYQPEMLALENGNLSARARPMTLRAEKGNHVDLGEETTLNLGGSWRVRRSIDVTARVTNLFDREYEEALGYPALGRSGMVGVRIAIGR